MTDFFNSSNEEEEFRDIPDEVEEGVQSDPVNVPNVSPVEVRGVQVLGPQPTEEELAEQEEIDRRLSEELGEEDYSVQGGLQPPEEEEDFSQILDDARFRLELGRLYEMVMKHNLFEGQGFDPKASEVVQKEIIKFAKERMEIMLGMRQAKQAPQEAQQITVASDFNDLEVKVLKEFASKMTQGKSASPEANQVASKLNTIGTAAPRQEMRPISQPVPRQQPAQRADGRDPQTRVGSNGSGKPLQQKPKTPLKREKLERLAEEFGVNPKDIGYKPIKKPLHKMTLEELKKRNEEAQARQEGAKAAPQKDARPMPTYEQQKIHYEQNLGAASNGTVSFIMGLIENQKNKRK